MIYSIFIERSIVDYGTVQGNFSFISDLLCEFTLQIIENCIKLIGFFLFALIRKMEKHRKDHIYERVQSEFGVNVFRHYYYCSGLSLENLKTKLKIRHGQECRILVRFDHIVVEESDGEIIVYLLVSHNSGKCADFLHQGEVDCAFYFY